MERGKSGAAYAVNWIGLNLGQAGDDGLSDA